MDWYYKQNDERKGPLTTETIKALLEDGTLSRDTLVQNDRMGDTWAEIAVIPVLAGRQTSAEEAGASGDAEIGQEFLRKQEDAERRKALQRRRMRIAAVGVAAVVLVIWGVAFFAKSKPGSRGGVDAEDERLGSLADMEKVLVGKYEMEKELVLEAPGLRTSAAQMYRYTKPKCSRGKNVSGSGMVLLLASDRGVVDGVLASFPSPGLRGDFVEDPSLVSLFMDKYWVEQGGPKERVFKTKDQALTEEFQETCGYADLPDDGGYVVIDKPRLRGIWVEFGLDKASTVVFLETKH